MPDLSGNRTRRSGREANLEAPDGNFWKGSQLVMVGVANVFFCTTLPQTKNYRGLGRQLEPM